ncbi:MAG: DEAD/DEAH box helicase, partial [Lachnospiraceae bacterium]|nr:DEAD/DEAH box helicase [Lachnospiraceae bacterium]
METNNDAENGKDRNEAALTYRDSGIDERIVRAVEEMGFEHMTPIQEQAIPVFLSGKDVIGQAQTGTGKTAAFGIPILEKIDPENKGLQAVILCPTRELAMQAADELRKFAKYLHGIKVLPIYGGQDIVRQIKNLKGGVQIIVGTPGRVMDHMRRHTIKMEQVHTVVLDEADEMLNMGFREDIEAILGEMPEERQTGLFSATMPRPILEITKKYQKDAVFLKMTPKEVTIPLIKQAYYMVRHQDKEEVLCRLMDYYDPSRALIFCNTKRMVDELTEHLKARGYEVEGLHGDLSQNQRDTVMNLFKGGRAAVLIAPDDAARGIDVDNVEAVFNFDVPEDIEYYVHRI